MDKASFVHNCTSYQFPFFPLRVTLRLSSFQAPHGLRPPSAKANLVPESTQSLPASPTVQICITLVKTSDTKIITWITATKRTPVKPPKLQDHRTPPKQSATPVSGAQENKTLAQFYDVRKVRTVLKRARSQHIRPAP